MFKNWKLAAIVALCGCAHADPAPPLDNAQSSARYEVTIFDNFGGATVKACFEGFPVQALIPVERAVAHGLLEAWWEEGALDVRGGRVGLPEPSRSTCVTYKTRFHDVMFRPRERSSVLVSQGAWLLRPDPFPHGLETTIDFELPPGAHVSVPWPTTNGTYHPGTDAFFWSGYNVFGHFFEQRLQVGPTSIDVAHVGPEPSSEDLRRWLTRAVEVVASVGARFPRDRLHVVVLPITDLDTPVAFGMVRRGGGASVLLIPSTGASAAQLEANWVAIHELSHLWLPRLQGRDRWLTEGIATYLQEVLRARCGIQSSAASWQQLRKGFERGRKSGTGRTLARESRDVHQTGSYQRVYWAGTAFALEADVRLRQTSNDGMTLLRALDLAQPRWSQQQRTVAADEVLTTLDEVTGAGFLSDLGRQYASRTDFPPTSYLDASEYDSVRAQIMKTDAEACRLSAGSSR